MNEHIDNSLPQYDLGKVETDAGFFKALFQLHAIQAMNCIPAIVESYDRATHMAEVRPLIKYETRVTDGKLAFDRPLYTVPVHQICQGGFLIDAPMFAGDTGLLFSIDREWITAKKENSKVVLKNRDPKNVSDDDNKGPVVADSEGILSFEYGFFLPCSWAETGLSDGDGVVVKIPTKDGVVAIKIDRDGKVTFGGEVRFEKKIYGTDAEFSGLVKAKDFKTDDCEILELDVVVDAKIDNGVTTLTIKKFKFLRSQIIGEAKEVKVYGDGAVGPQGPQGERGPQGPQGEQGEQGIGIESVSSDALPEDDYTSTNVTVLLTNGDTDTFLVKAKNGADGKDGKNGKDGENGRDGATGPQGVGITSIESDATPTIGYTSTNVTVTLSNNTTQTFTVNAKDGAPEEQSQTVEVITGINPSFSGGKLTLQLTKVKIPVSSFENATTTNPDVVIFDINNAVDVVTDVKYSTSTLELSQAKIPIISVGDTTSETAPTNETVFTATEHETDI